MTEQAQTVTKKKVAKRKPGAEILREISTCRNLMKCINEHGRRPISVPLIKEALRKDGYIIPDEGILLGKPLWEYIESLNRAPMGRPQGKRIKTHLKGEAEAQNELAWTLAESGWSTRMEVLIPGVGEIDIVAENAQSCLLIEVKVDTLVDCAKGIGQILMYAHYWPTHCVPVLAVPRQHSEEPGLIEICRRCGVELWPL